MEDEGIILRHYPVDAVLRYLVHHAHEIEWQYYRYPKGSHVEAAIGQTKVVISNPMGQVAPVYRILLKVVHEDKLIRYRIDIHQDRKPEQFSRVSQLFDAAQDPTYAYRLHTTSLILSKALPGFESFLKS